MRVLSLAALGILIVVALLASSSQVLAVRSTGVFAQTINRGALPAAEQPRKLVEGSNGVAAVSFDASKKPAATDSSPSTVFDPDRMSKRRVRRGSDPIHNKC